MKSRHIPFILLAVVIVILTTATIIEKYSGSQAVYNAIYGSWWFAATWALLAVASVAVILRSQLMRRPVALMLHLAFIVILAGALTTHIFAIQGTTHVRLGAPQKQFSDSEKHQQRTLPFTLSLRNFQVETYPGTQSPMDYVSDIDIQEDGKTVHTMTISMNHVGSYNGYRFYQSGYDDDGQGTILTVSHDPWGIGITYTGYALLFLSMLLMLILPNETFRKMLRSHASARIAVILLLSVGMEAQAAQAPKTLPKDVAAQFGHLYTYYNGRVCPLQTVAKDFTVKLYGKPAYQGLTAEQVFTGWVFFPTDWIDQPVIKVKGRVADILGIKGSYASYNQFHGTEGYKLDKYLGRIYAGENMDGERAIKEADEKMNILLMLFNGQMMKIYPYRDSTQVTWLSQGDNLPKDMPEEKGLFVKKSLDYIGELLWMKRYAELSDVIQKIRTYQQKEAAGMLPSDELFKAERLYNSAEQTRPLAMILMTIGLLTFIYYLYRWQHGKDVGKAVNIALNIALTATTLYLLFIIALRGYISGHLPLSNGFETMQFMSLCALLLTICLQRRYKLIMPFGLLLSGMTLLVAMMGEANPKISHLMPVLNSPLLSLHVSIIMMAYTLFALITFNSVFGILVERRGARVESTQRSTLNVNNSLLLLYPAVFCLAAGIFIGAIWANQSWGRYWGWDPKEVWALITLLVYAVPLHRNSMKWLRKPTFFHLYLILAFLTILMTYFGVNYFLGGMHSYA